MANNILAVIMGGGAGTRLFPLTKDRAKPAVPIAGKYRLVDVPISNCINSGIRHIYVLTQFNSASLNSHIHQSYTFDRFSRGFVEILAAQQTISSAQWYQGTADAVRQNFIHLMREDFQHFLILSGDQLYRMDYRQLMHQHLDTRADITIAVIPVKREQASALGILQADNRKRIVRFVEKPQEPRLLDELKLPADSAAKLRLPVREECLLASMGIYVFNRDILRQALDNDKTDFGKHIVPDAIQKYRVFSYIFQGYWEDVGTVKSFYEANLALCSDTPSFDFFSHEVPIYTHARMLPPSKIVDSFIRHALVADGCVIHNSRIENSIIGVRSMVGNGCELIGTILMGCDYYEREEQTAENLKKGIPPMGLGNNCKIRRAIIDKNAHLGDNVTITDKSNAPDLDAPNYYIRNGIVVVPKNAVIPAGTNI